MTSVKILNAGILAANGVYKASQTGFTRIICGQTFLVSKASIPELGEDFQECWAIQETSKTPITLYATTERSEFPPSNGWIPVAGITPPPILEIEGLPKKETGGGAEACASALAKLPGTRRTFWENTFKFEHKGKFVKDMMDAKFGLGVVLNDTIFHPQGGGQPTDYGTIKGSKSGAEFVVSRVSEDKEGTIYHFGAFKTPVRFEADESVDMKIDGEKRALFAKIHSAGHLLDHAISLAGYPELNPTKGFHFPDGPYVEYKGNIPAPERAAALEVVQAKCDELVNADLPMEVLWLTESEYRELTGCDPHTPEPIRVVQWKGYDACGCGGTHVESSKQIGRITDIKFKKKGKVFRVSYKVH